MMQTDHQDLPALVKEVRRQLSLSQEGLARELGVGFATVKRWENNHVKPSKLARAQLDAFCSKWINTDSDMVLKSMSSGRNAILEIFDITKELALFRLFR